jgi:hypothetical protein
MGIKYPIRSISRNYYYNAVRFSETSSCCQLSFFVRELPKSTAKNKKIKRVALFSFTFFLQAYETVPGSDLPKNRKTEKQKHTYTQKARTYLLYFCLPVRLLAGSCSDFRLSNEFRIRNLTRILEGKRNALSNDIDEYVNTYFATFKANESVDKRLCVRRS